MGSVARTTAYLHIVTVPSQYAVVYNVYEFNASEQVRESALVYVLV